MFPRVAIGDHSLIGANAVIGHDGFGYVGAHALVGMDASVQQDLSDHAVARAPRPDVRMRTDGHRGAIGFTAR